MTWDWTAIVVTTVVPAIGAAVPGFTATDAAGNQVYDSGNSAYLLLAPEFTPAPRTTSISAVAPAAPAGTADVTVTSAGGTDTTLPGDQFTFGGSYALISQQSDTSLVVTAPPGERVDSTSVSVTSVGGTASAGCAYTAPDLCGGGCAFTSANAVSATTGVPISFTVSATGRVPAGFTEKGKLPRGVTFVDNGDGTATLSGTPVNLRYKVAAGTYRDKIKAVFSYGTSSRTIVQTLTLTVS